MDCSRVGFAPGITVGTEDGVAATELCLDDTCHPLAFRDGRELIDDEPRTYFYDLTVVIDGDERVLTGEVETRAFWVNGEGCEPKTANAHLQVAADGSVTIGWAPFGR